MKRLERTEFIIGENTFYIMPFAAFTAANISIELTAILSPMLGSMGTVVGEIDIKEAMKAANQPSFDADNASEEAGGGFAVENIMNMDMEKLMPAFARAFSSLSGDKFERLMRRLLVDNQNISVRGEATEGRLVNLTADTANEVFCGELQDMLTLCYDVIKVNYNGFFKKLGAQFGRQLRAMAAESPSAANTASLT